MRKPIVKRKDVVVKEAVLQNYDGSYTLQEMHIRLQEAVDAIPEEFRKTAKFEVEKEETWERYDPSPTIKASLNVWYTRPETDEELAKRQAESDKHYDLQLAHDRKEFERLQKQFGE